jgi:hypothetical protein
MSPGRPTQHPPLLATWLLERFCADVALAGDLVEQYREGKSIAWYWKQAIAAVGVYSTSQIIEHKWLAVRAIATGYVIWYVLNNMFLHGVLKPLMATDDGMALRVVYMSIGYAFWIANGWIIARLHRPYSTAMVMAYVLWAIAASVPPVYAAVSAIGDPNGPSLTWEIGARLATLFSLITGGVLSTYRDQVRQLRTAGEWPRSSRAYAAR